MPSLAALGTPLCSLATGWTEALCGQAPVQPPAEDELEAASAFVTGDDTGAPSTEAAAPEAAPQTLQESQPVVASEPEPEPEPSSTPEPPQATPASAQGSEQETTVNIEGTPVRAPPPLGPCLAQEWQ